MWDGGVCSVITAWGNLQTSGETAEPAIDFSPTMDDDEHLIALLCVKANLG